MQDGHFGAHIRHPKKTTLYYIMGDQVRMKRDIRRHFILTFFFIFVQKKRGEQKHALKGQIKIFKGCSFACIFFLA